MPPVEILTKEEIQDRRRELLASVGGDYDALRDRAEQYALDSRELAVLTELDNLSYLLSASE